MAKKSHLENTVGPWGREKLDLLQEYLGQYTTALKNQNWATTVYIDAFAGAGRSKLRQAEADPDQGVLSLDEEAVAAAEEYINGSPLRALRIPTPFDRYFFLDEDPERVELLEPLRTEHPELNIRVKACDANPVLIWIADRLTPRHKAVAFLDQYADQLNWATVAALARTGVTEVIINLPINMNFNRLLPKSGIVSPANAATLDRAFPSPDWREAAYPQAPTFFGEAPRRAADVPRALLEVYVRGLRAIFDFVASPRLVRTPRGLPLYYLIWAWPSVVGFRIADHILKQGEHVELPT
jgi:three-Cys-motif partner protein